MKKNFTRNHRNMRNGISIVEMMVAVFLFGVISTIGYKYTKNFYDVSLTSKQALVSSVIEQATQLSNAYDLYEIKIGAAPTDDENLTDSNIKILREIPPKVLEITNSGWDIVENLDLDGSGNDVAFIYPIDASTLNTTEKKLEYCNILNNIANSQWDYNSTVADDVSNASDEEIGDEGEMYTNGTYNFQSIMCYAVDADNFKFAFIKKVNP